MTRKLKKSTLEKLLEIGGTSDGRIIKQHAVKLLGDELDSLCDCQAIVQIGEGQDVAVADGDSEEPVDVTRRDGKNMRFSPSDGWVGVVDEEIALYKIDFGWLIRQIMDALEIPSRCTAISILDDKIWGLGQHRIERQHITIIIVRNTIESGVFGALCDYLSINHSALNPALVISLNRRLPAHLRLPHQNILVRLEEVIVIESDDFEINKQILAGRIGARPTQLGFSGGYRTLRSGGKTYEFSPTQREAIEFMDGQDKPIHQREILAETSSREGKKLRELFKKKGRMHDAWNEIIKSDGRGNYWLEY